MQKRLASALAGATLMVSAGASADPNTVSNFAFGGAKTSDANLTLELVPFFGGAASGQGLVVPGLQQQIGWAHNTLEGDIVSKRDLFVVYAGTNDLLGELVTGSNDFATAMPAAAANVYGALEAMSALGAEYFVVPNVPPLGALPILGGLGLTPEQLNDLSGLSWYYNNNVLAPTLDAFRAAHPEALVVSVDIWSATFAGLYSGQFTNITDACYDAATGQIPPVVADGGCAGYAFVDTVHPTEELYAVWAQSAVTSILGALGASSKPGAKGNLMNRHHFRRIVTLGDSFSDTGSFDNVWNRALPFDFLPDVTYQQNRFSTGDGLIDMLEDSLNVQFNSSAYIQ